MSEPRLARWLPSSGAEGAAVAELPAAAAAAVAELPTAGAPANEAAASEAAEAPAAAPATEPVWEPRLEAAGASLEDPPPGPGQPRAVWRELYFKAPKHSNDCSISVSKFSRASTVLSFISTGILWMSYTKSLGLTRCKAREKSVDVCNNPSSS